MIKLIGILKEIYVDKQGNLVGEADFVILEGGMRGGIFKNKNQINVSEYINFTTKLASFRKKDVANKIFKQIISIYNQSALKKYNDSINFTPSLSYDKGGNWDAPNYSIMLSNKLNMWGALEPSHYYPETGFDDFIKQMRQTLDVDDSDFKDTENISNQSKDSERFKDLDVKDLENKIEYIPIICIPKFEFSGKTIDQFDDEIINKNVPIDDNHVLYTKSNLLEDLNEIGLFLLSQSTKSPIVDLNEKGYKLYIIEYISEYIGYRKDGSSYTMTLGEPDKFGSEHRYKDIATLYVMVKNNENVENAVKRLGGKGSFNLYDSLFSDSFEGEKEKHEIKQIKRDIKEIKNPKLDINFFNYLKKNIYKDNNVKPSKEYSNVQYEHENNHVQNINGVLSVKGLK